MSAESGRGRFWGFEVAVELAFSGIVGFQRSRPGICNYHHLVESGQQTFRRVRF